MKENLYKEQEEAGGLGASPQKNLDVMPSRTLENALLQSRIYIAFFIDLCGDKE